MWTKINFIVNIFKGLSKKFNILEFYDKNDKKT